MSFIDLNVLKKKEDDAQKHIRNSSPMLICNADFGVLFIAPNKDRVENRIHKVHDRIMCVTRGLFTHGLPLWQSAINRADMMSVQYSRGDVSARRLVQETSQVVSQFYESLKHGPLKAEIVFAGLRQSVEEDYIGYIDFQGRIRTIQKIGFIGNFDAEAYRDTTKEEKEKKDLDDANKALVGQWCREMTAEEMIAVVKRSGQVAGLLFGNSKVTRVETAVLDRREFVDKNFNRIFKRLNP